MEELSSDKFDNLDSWVPKTLMPLYEKDILNNLLKMSKVEEKKKDTLGGGDPFPLGGGGRFGG